MSVRLEVAVVSLAQPATVWSVLTDWPRQSRWIPLTSVRVRGEASSGPGVRVEALSGFWLGRLPLGLLDRFVVTGWSPPAEGQAELEVLHLGPWFTGEGVFHLGDLDGRTRVSCTELVTVPGGPLPNRLIGLALPLMRWGFQQSLAQLAAVVEGRRA